MRFFNCFLFLVKVLFSKSSSIWLYNRTQARRRFRCFSGGFLDQLLFLFQVYEIVIIGSSVEFIVYAFDSRMIIFLKERRTTYLNKQYCPFKIIFKKKVVWKKYFIWMLAKSWVCYSNSLPELNVTYPIFLNYRSRVSKYFDDVNIFGLKFYFSYNTTLNSHIADTHRKF